MIGDPKNFNHVIFVFVYHDRNKKRLPFKPRTLGKLVRWQPLKFISFYDESLLIL